MAVQKKTLLYWTLIIIFAGLFIGFLVAWIKERDANTAPEPELPSSTVPPSTSPPVDELPSSTVPPSTSPPVDELPSSTVSPSTSPPVDELPSSTVPPSTPAPLDEDRLRLNETIVPLNYRLSIRNDPREASFSGSLTIDLKVQEAIDSIVLHCKDLTIDKFSLNKGATIAKVSIDEEYELCTFDLDKDVEPGEYKLSLDYRGFFKLGQITGFYNSSYLSLDNEIHRLSATKFEPTYARMAFPCFDEPHFKASYEITIIHPSHLTALSNEIEIGSKALPDNWSETSFRKTVPMSSYLVAFIICDFKFTETKTTLGTRVRVYSRPDQVEKTRFALDAAATVLRHYENYTGIDYVFKKMDLIGLPEFVSGAMENWGLITYKETAILFSEKESSAAEQRSIAGTISHELAHMWFGNLLTLSWWNELYLNEGYASFMEYKGQNAINTKWNIFDRFLQSDLHSAMRADSLSSAHPLKSPNVITPNQITAQFDTITYSKGAAILRMLENVIGPNRFQEATKKYLQENKFKVSTTELVLKYYAEAIKEATKVDGKEFMRKWIEQNGFPVVSLERQGESKVKLSQRRYASLEHSIDDQEPWNIEVRYLLDNGQTGSWVLTKMSDTFELPSSVNSKQMIKLNLGGDYYYIVNYTQEDWSLLTSEAKNGKLSNLDRANLIFDAYQLADKAQLSYETFFTLLDNLDSESNYLPWSVAITSINSLLRKLSTSSGASLMKYKTYIRKLVAQAFDSTVDNLETSHLAALSPDQLTLRLNLLSLACGVEHKACLDTCSVLFRKYLDDGAKVDPNIRTAVYAYGLQNSKSESDWSRMWDMYTAEKDALEKAKLMSALTNAKSVSLISLLLEYSSDQDKINNENFFSVQNNIASNSDTGRAMVWDYIRSNWDNLVERFGLNDRRLGNYVRSVSSGFGTPSRLVEMENFFAQYPDAGAGEAARAQALETVRQNIAWLEANSATIEKSLKKRDETEAPWLNWRLDEQVRPEHYNLNLSIDVDNETFEGSVEIQIRVGRPLKYLILHSKDLKIVESAVYAAASNRLVSSSEKAWAHDANQMWIIPLERIIMAGNYVARLKFTGQLGQSMSGLYVSKYTDNKTQKEVKLATTQFEAVYARKAFPCFDEPGFKATFAIAITHARSYSAIGNMPVDYVQQVDQDWTRTVFMKTVKMSTYPLAFVVSDFTPKTDSSSSISFSIYTYNPTINLAKVDYALSKGPAVLKFFGDYFGIPYPLPKLDMISVPDFSMGAMENWGLVTYRDVYILYDPLESSSASKMTVCYIIAHELAHMWFGDLTTMKWWNDLYLNEGFAQMMQYKATSAVEPSWKYHEHFAINELARVFEADSSQSTRAILSNVRNENDISAAFDAVTYAKGASIIRMLENTMGEQDFRRGISNYLKKYSYQNTESIDLWRELTDASSDRIDTNQLMSGWLKKEGFPVVTVSLNSTSQKLQLKQERFLKDFAYTNSTDVWNIPMTYRLIDTKNVELEPKAARLQFNDRQMQTDIVMGKNELIKFNTDQVGVYILNYPIDVWNQWSSLLSNPDSVAWGLSPLDRSNLLSDAFYLSRSGRLSYRISLELANFLKHEDSYVVWRTARFMLEFLAPFVQSEDRGVAYNSWLLSKIVSTKYEELGWKTPEAEKEMTNQRRLRALIVDWTCQANHAKCLEEANKHFDEYKESKKSNRADYVHDPDMFNIFLVHAMRTVTDDEGGDKFDFLQQQYNDATTTDRKLSLLRGMTSVKSVAKLQKLLDKSLDESFIRKQDFFSFLADVGDNPLGLKLAWNFYRENYETLVKSFGMDDSNLGRAVYRFAEYFTTQAQLDEVKSFFKKYPQGGAGELYRKQAIELMEANIAWSKKHYNTVAEFFIETCDEQVCPWKVYRLDPRVTPTLYEVSIQVNTETNVYNGSVRTHLSINASQDHPITHIIMHAASILNVTRAPTILGTQTSVDYGFRYPPLEFYVIKLSNPIKENIQVIVQADFDGDLRLGGQVGLYRGWYEHQNRTNNLAATQFEATHARKMFPCLDEPAFKPEVSMTIIHPENKTLTLSNMPLEKQTAAQPGWMISHFKRSIHMPTYLIAILVSDFECSHEILEQNEHREYAVNVSICASKIHEAKEREYALQTTLKVVKAFEDKLGHPYQLPKLDQVAIPQFSAGAMENWGLIKYREPALLWTPEANNAALQRSVASIISHELAHMWFGNQATCSFWGDLFLNEGFASFFEFVAVNIVEPDWKYFDLFAYYDTMGAMSTDAQESSLPIVRPVTRPQEMPYNSSITYSKGSTMLNMLYHLMGEDKFLKALSEYLSEHANGTVVTADLLTALEKHWEHKELGLKSFMDSWLFKPGFPYLNLTMNKEKQTYEFTQERYLLNGQSPKNDTIYSIPFSFYKLNAKTRKLESSPTTFLTTKTGSLPADFSSFTKVNPDFGGFYLVNYPADYWEEITKRLVANDVDLVNQLTVNDRAELFMSSYLLTRAKLVDYLTTFRLYNYLVHETHFVPWYFYSYTFSNLAQRMSFSEYRPSIQQFERRLVKPHYSEAMWDNNGTNVEQQFKTNLITIACRSGTIDCLKHAHNHFQEWKTSQGKREKLPANLQMNILSYGVRQSKSSEDYEFVWQAYKNETKDTNLRLDYLLSLSMIEDFGQLKPFLERALDDRVVSNSNYLSLINSIIESPVHQTDIWNYFVDNYSILSTKLSRAQVGDILSRFALYTVDQERKNKISEFMAAHSDISASTTKSVISSIHENLDFMDKHKKQLGEWFTENACGELTPTPCAWSALRIDKTIMTPSHYNVAIQVNLTTNAYNGSVTIKVKAEKSFDVILLHVAEKLKVSLEYVKKDGGDGAQLEARVSRYQPNDYLLLQFDSKQPAGDYVLSFKFKAQFIADELSGLYLSTYTDGDGSKRQIASTQFEFHDARKVFPCFDEPAFKAIFKMTIIHEAHMNATLANMRSISTASIAGTQWVETQFDESPPMPSYLVAMMVSDFVRATDTVGDIVWSVYASRMQTHKMQYALEKAPKCLAHLESKLGIKQPESLKKIDLLAIPDFYYGAMENWGLVTFRESALLYHEKDTTAASKMSILGVIAHELAHFWFGNLVTCENWNFLFLNEAFATYMQYTTLKEVEPDWKYDEQFMINAMLGALVNDASSTSHPLVRNVNKTSEIAQFSSSIIYSKGASLLRMIEFVMGGETNFYKSLTEYFQEFNLTNTVPQNLLDKFDAHFTTPDDKVPSITNLMDEWIYQNGFPYINVSRASDSGSYKFVQSQFLLSGTTNKTTVWKIPISYYKDSDFKDSATKFLITKNGTLSGLATSQPIKINVNHTGFYLTNYSPELWQAWIKAMVEQGAANKLSVHDRAGLLLDSTLLAQANLVSYYVPLSLSRYLENEEHFTPWRFGLYLYSQLRRYMLFGSTIGDEFEEHVLSTARRLYQKLGWPEKAGADLENRLRADVFELVCSYNDRDCLETSSKMFDAWKQDKLNNRTDKLPSPNLLPIVLKHGLKDREDWLYVWSEYLKESSPSLKSSYLLALANADQQDLVLMLLTQAFEGRVIPAKDTNSVVSAVAASYKRANLQTLWNFYKKNCARLSDSKSSNSLYVLLSVLSNNYFFNKTQRNELQAHFQQFSSSISLTQRTTLLNTVDKNIRWVEARAKEIENFLLCNSEKCAVNEFRLNPNIKPTRYDLSFTIDLEKSTFEGTAQIKVSLEDAIQAKEVVKQIVLHAASNLNITEAEIVREDKQSIKLLKTFKYSRYDYFVLPTKSPINDSMILLNFKFNSKLSSDMLGLYKSEYYDPKSQKLVSLASTQFQNLYARRAFPCFDEPSIRSVFHVTLKHDPKYTALSNTPQKNTWEEGGLNVTEFEDTPSMVTYLLAFVVSDFDCKHDSKSLDNVTVGVCSSPPEAEKIGYSLKMAPKVIKSFEDKFKFKYMLPKMDLLAIPDFSAGAMENWGLLTFRETALLYDDKHSTAADKMYVLSVVAHEIAHMWFGNTLTCAWWSDLFLNEGFASYMEYFSVHEVEPSWNYHQLFYTTDYITGMNADASAASHPLIRSVDKPSDVPYTSNIIYQKGASILRMFNFVLGDDQFYTLLGEYVSQFQYRNVRISDLISVLGQAKVDGLEDVKTFLENWTLKAGFPYVNVSKIGSNEYSLTQARYVSKGTLKDNSQVYIIPLSYYDDYEAGTTFKMHFMKEQKETIQLPEKTVPFKLNIDAQGFYVVNYDLETWNKWAQVFQDTEKLKSLKLTSQDYSNLLFDAFNLAKVKLLPYENALKLTCILKHDEHFGVWSTGSTIFASLLPYLQTNETTGVAQLMQKELRDYAQSLVQSLYNDYSLQSAQRSDVVAQRLHSTISSFACAYGLARCHLEARVEFQKWRQNQTEISPNLIVTVLRYALQESTDASDWEHLWNRYEQETTTSIKLNYLQGLAQTSNTELLNRLFERANDQKLVRRQNYLSIYSYAVRNPVGLRFAWNYFKTNYKQIQTNRVTQSGMGTLAGYFAGRINSAADKKEFEQFFNTHTDVDISPTSLASALQVMDENIGWVNNHRQTVYDWLKQTNRVERNSNQSSRQSSKRASFVF